MQNLVSSLDQALNAIRVLNVSLPSNPDLADRLGQAHAFYVLEENAKPALFGFSKFVGYEGLTPAAYLRNYKQLDGRNTEHALSKWFEELRHGSPAYGKLFNELASWMAQFGKRPREGKRQKVRLMVVRQEFRDPESANNGDRRLLELMLAVADMLPIEQRHELRSKL